ncbi:MAG: LacI family DNA-binding transcriptional regulator [Oscillospiraceae bacterium]|jgi:LacI family transcriptional regulator|nr:LacI family DNA-binding transcriptional regulator [Oscillospiraceae bacterium]
MPVTLKKIAELADVSIGTVDRALHNRGRVSPEVVKRVQEIAAFLNYKPNSVAKSLALRSRKLKIALILHIDHNTFYDTILEGVAQMAGEIRDYGVSVVIKRGRDFDAAVQLQLIDEVLAEGFHALAIVPINHPDIKKKLTELHAQKFPVVFLGAMLEDVPCLGYVGCDYASAGEITAGLINLITGGTGKLLIFAPTFRMLGNQQRTLALEARLKKCYGGIKIQKIIEMSGDDIYSYNETKNAFAQYPDTDTLICPGAISGRGTVQALKDMGLYQKVKVVVYDYSDAVQEGLEDKGILAAITQNPQQQGYRAIKILFEYITVDTVPCDCSYVQTQIVLRESIREIENV